MRRLSPVFSSLWRVRVGGLCRSSIAFHGIDMQATTPQTMNSVVRAFERAPKLVQKVSVHFDDAYVSAAPWVEKLATCGVSVTLFVPTDWVGTEFFGREVCSWGVLRELSSLPGVKIQSHAASQVNLTRLDPDDVRDELAGSKEVIETEIQSSVTEIAYPRGRWTPKIGRLVQAAG